MYSYYANFNSGGGSIASNIYRAFGFSVRCVKEKNGAVPDTIAKLIDDFKELKSKVYAHDAILIRRDIPETIETRDKKKTIWNVEEGDEICLLMSD